jgi:hypothetical protein
MDEIPERRHDGKTSREFQDTESIRDVLETMGRMSKDDSVFLINSVETGEKIPTTPEALLSAYYQKKRDIRDESR